jgi:hypothetical protein
MGIQRENHLQINNTNLAKLEMEVKERTLRESSGSSLIVLGNSFGAFPGVPLGQQQAKHRNFSRTLHQRDSIL